ncbi:MAG: tetratricopeptide repeat protein [Syntrophales bacterium]|jgi:tetratricopeptide (TPR) repeat protein|nr:tetratricopeptide repeat protein [Syntrophales bacterium]MDY0044560.1 tetratricopeptide repeat protein [Syntrophales bacterium]
MRIEKLKSGIILLPCLFFCFFLLTCGFQPGASRTTDNVLISRSDNADTSYYHYSLAVLHTLNQQFDKAVDEYRKALSIHEHSPFLMVELATIYIKKNDLSSAVELLETSLLYHPDYIDTHLLLGGVYGKLKKYDNAISEYKTVIELDPAKVEPYLLLGLLYTERKNYTYAISVLKKLMDRDSESYMGAYYLSKIYAEMELYKEATKWMEKTVSLNPEFETALADLGLLYQIGNEDAKAVDVYRNYIKRNSDNITLRQRLGKLLLKLEKYDEAATEFEEILNLDDSNKEARFSLGIAYFFGRIDYEKALDLFKDIALENPLDERVRYFLASVYEERGSFSEALAEFEKISPSSDFFIPGRIHMGLIMKQQNQTADAIKLMHTTIENRKKEPELYDFLAALYEDEKKFENAFDTLQKGLKEIPENIDLRYKIGVLYEKTGYFDESMAVMREILQMDPENAEALNFIGYSFADRGINLEEAEVLITKAMELKPGNGYITDSLGWLYYRQNKISQAISFLEKAASLLPEDVTIAEHLADAYAKGGYARKALDVYQKILENKPEDETIRKKIKTLLNE